MRGPAVLAALRRSGGGTVAVSEESIEAALMELARSGLYVEPTCAMAAAALTDLTASGAIRPEETTVVVLTGTGIKATPRIAELLGLAP
ncbi:pyridoxal-phosphate dependent enzyme [Methylobacterium oryzae CBMB20]